eukprot:CAMPEP_0115230288 /NCGR_PEP_ID=MMETSP0270-20121206/32638_1 /TAXON_ID=71861 /ORGANISM="Scrippsiella trochoidea, Strain CCMP3099" /LENGTH=201 /DNA_ID=CAMNT_0002644875 /DNA_START=37 /DNA_END=645 /DNA_ORIENTATION=-
MYPDVTSNDDIQQYEFKNMPPNGDIPDIQQHMSLTIFLLFSPKVTLSSNDDIQQYEFKNMPPNGDIPDIQQHMSLTIFLLFSPKVTLSSNDDIQQYMFKNTPPNGDNFDIQQLMNLIISLFILPSATLFNIKQHRSLSFNPFFSPKVSYLYVIVSYASDMLNSCAISAMLSVRSLSRFCLGLLKSRFPCSQKPNFNFRLVF